MLNHDEDPLSIINIDFFTIAFGPSHHVVRFFQNSKKTCIGSLQYNIYFEQVCNTEIKMKDLKVKINSIKEFPVCSNFRIVMPEDKIESSMSTSKIGNFNTKKTETDINFNFLMKNNTEPNISFITTMENIMASSVQICIWKDSRTISENEMVRTIITKSQSTGIKVDDVQVSVESGDENTPNESSENESSQNSESEDNDYESSNEEESTPDSDRNSEIDSEMSSGRNNVKKGQFHLLGECHIGFATILKNILEFINKKNMNALDGVSSTISVMTGKKINAEIDFKHLQQNSWDIKMHKLWYFGRKVGEIDIKIEAKNLPFVRQMTIGVLTGRGVTFASTPWPVDDISKGSYSRKDLPEPIKDLYDNLSDFKKRDCTKNGHRRVNLSAMDNILKESIEILKKSEKKSMVCLIYKNVSLGIKAQEILIELACHCLQYIDIIDPNIKGKYFEIINLILHRGELDLDQVGFTKSENKSIKKLKKKVSVKYQYLIYESLRFSIDKLTRKAVDFYRRDCIVFCIAIAYFKIPEFRKSFIDAITQKPIPEIEEFRNTNFNKDRTSENQEGNNFIERFFNWDRYFYEKIPDSDQKNKNLTILAQIITEKRWEEKLAKRGVAFFLIINRWAEYVKTIVVNDKIDWFDIPGYSTVLKAMLTELKERKISEYPDALIDASCGLLSDEK